MVRVGLVGIGFMGWIHYLAYQRSRCATLAAFCSRDAKKRSGDWRGIQGNFGPPSEQISIEGLDVFESLDQMLRSPNIDVIDICLPPHLHADVAKLAIASGKDVFCEKPFALHATDCLEVLDLARKHQRLVMVAHVLPYMGAFQYAYQLAASGKYGRPIGGYFKRIICDPSWIPDFYDPDTIGGPLIDLHVHDLHYIQLLFGKPTRIHAVGRIQGEVAKFAHVLYEFADRNVSVASSSGVIDGPARPFTHGFELQLEHATLQHEFAAFSDGGETMPLKIILRDGGIERPELPAADEVDAFTAEIDDMAASIVSRKAAARLDGEIARQAIELALQIQSTLQKSQH